MTLNSLIDKVVEEIQVLKNEGLNQQANDLVKVLIEKQQNRNKIFVYGAGRSGFIGRGFVMRLVQGGLPAFFVGESATPPMNPKDIVILISGSGKTDTVTKILEISKDLYLEKVLITSKEEKDPSGIDRNITVGGKTKIEKHMLKFPLASYFELNTFIFLECLIAKLKESSPNFQENIDKINERYSENKIIVL